MSERTIVSRESVPNYIPEQSEIQHVLFEDGEQAYHTRPSGPKNSSSRINVNSIELEILVSNWIDQIKSMVQVMADDEEFYIQYGQHIETLLQAFDREMDEALYAVYENIGWIHIHQVGINKASWREGRVVGAHLQIVDEKENSKDQKGIS